MLVGVRVTDDNVRVPVPSLRDPCWVVGLWARRWYRYVAGCAVIAMRHQSKCLLYLPSEDESPRVLYGREGVTFRFIGMLATLRAKPSRTILE